MCVFSCAQHAPHSAHQSEGWALRAFRLLISAPVISWDRKYCKATHSLAEWHWLYQQAPHSRHLQDWSQTECPSPIFKGFEADCILIVVCCCHLISHFVLCNTDGLWKTGAFFSVCWVWCVSWGVMCAGDGWLTCTVQTGGVWESSWFVLFHHVVFVVIIIVGLLSCLREGNWEGSGGGEGGKGLIYIVRIGRGCANIPGSIRDTRCEGDVVCD